MRDSAAAAAAYRAQVVADLSAAAAAIAANPSKLLLQGSSQLTYAEISLATALKKVWDMDKPLPHAAASTSTAAATASNPTSTTAGAEAEAAATGDTAAGTAAGGAAADETVADFMPMTKQLLQEFPELFQWAKDTAQQHWAAGASMPAA